MSPNPRAPAYSVVSSRAGQRAKIPCYQLVEDGRMVAFAELKVGDRFRMAGDPAFNPDAIRVVLSLSLKGGAAIVTSESSQDRCGQGLPAVDDDADYRGVDPKHRADVLEQNYAHLGFDRRAWDEARGYDGPQAPDRDAGSGAHRQASDPLGEGE